jgi:hypothetical protein
MWDYLRNVIQEFPEEIMGVCATPANNYLFKVHEDGRKLNKELAEAFHHTVYQLLFAANRARRDIQTAVSFLTTQVKAPVCACPPVMRGDTVKHALTSTSSPPNDVPSISWSPVVLPLWTPWGAC